MKHKVVSSKNHKTALLQTCCTSTMDMY